MTHLTDANGRQLMPGDRVCVYRLGYQGNLIPVFGTLEFDELQGIFRVDYDDGRTIELHESGMVWLAENESYNMSKNFPKLKPCPFCGSEGEYYTTTVYRKTFYTACCSDNKCIASLTFNRDDEPEMSFESFEKAAAAWNKRAGER